MDFCIHKLPQPKKIMRRLSYTQKYIFGHKHVHCGNQFCTDCSQFILIVTISNVEKDNDCALKEPL